MRRFSLWFLWLIFALFIIGRIVAYVTESWWYSEQGHANVYLTILSTRLALFALGAGLVVLVLGLNTRLAWRAEVQRRQEFQRALHSQIYSVLDEPPEENKQNLGLERLRRWAWRLGLGFFAFVGGAFASFNWPLWLSAFNAVPTGKREPIFGLDAGFYFFYLPALQFVWTFGFLLLCVTLIAVFLVYGHDNDFDLRGDAPAISSQALRHLSILLAAIFIWKAFGYRLDSYELLTTQQAAVGGEAFTGIGYTDARVRLPALWLMSAVALGVAIVIWLCGRRGELRNVVWTGGVYLAASAVVLVFLPGFTQALRVDPQGARLQTPYLTHHADWTRWAYSLENITDAHSKEQSSTHNAFPHLREASDLASTVSLWNEDELLKRLYRGSDEFAITNAAFGVRKINGQWRPVYLAARERSPIVWRRGFSLSPSSPVNLQNRADKDLEGNAWLHRHFLWTHGAGLVVVDANRLQGGSDDPLGYGVSPAELTQPQIYFGQWLPPTREQGAGRLAQQEDSGQTAANNAVSTVAPNTISTDAMPRAGGANGFRRENLVPQTLFNPDVDYAVLNPNALAARAAGLASSEYSPQAGVPVGSRWRKFLLAWRFADPRFYLSPLVDESSRVVWRRRINARCAALAPFIDWQNAKPRPVIHKGRIVWLLQGATSSRYAPYAQESRDGANYHRASVLATVDAFSGQTNFFISDSDDVLLRSYAKAFPRLFQPWNQMSPELQQQVVYSQAALEKQARIWLHLRQIESPDENSALQNGAPKWEIGQTFQAALPMGQSRDVSTRVITSGVTLQPAGDNSVPHASLMATRREDGSSQLWFWSPEEIRSVRANSANAIFLPASTHWAQIDIERKPQQTLGFRPLGPRRLAGVTLNWNGQTARATNLEDAIQLLEENRRNSKAAPKLSAEQKWRRARDLAQMMRNARQRRDWSAYGLAEEQLMELLNPQPVR